MAIVARNILGKLLVSALLTFSHINLKLNIKKIWKLLKSCKRLQILTQENLHDGLKATIESFTRKAMSVDRFEEIEQNIVNTKKADEEKKLQMISQKEVGQSFDERVPVLLHRLKSYRKIKYC